MLDQLVQALWLIVLVSGIPLLASMIVGIVVSILQAATQVQESTLTFVPKVLAVLLVLLLLGPSLFAQLEEFSVATLESISRPVLE